MVGWAKRYLVFVARSASPRGGWDDFFDSFDTVDAARAGAAQGARGFSRKTDTDEEIFYQIIDTKDTNGYEGGHVRADLTLQPVVIHWPNP